MFDLYKDVDKYTGIPPYASEYYGVYQPLLGWESALTKSWIQRGSVLSDPPVARILDGRFDPGPEEVQNDDPLEFIAMPLKAGVSKSPFTVLLSKSLNSELMLIIHDFVQTFVKTHKGRLPNGSEWMTVIDPKSFADTTKGPLRQVNDRLRTRRFYQMRLTIPSRTPTPDMIAAAKVAHLESMKYESQIASYLLAYATGEDGLDPNELKKLFLVQEAPPLADIVRPTDPLANLDPDSRSGALSPVGFLHLFRQFFFDLGTFPGEPVEHVWLAPGTTIELIEVSTRRILTERTEESSDESTTRNEQSLAVKDELSEAVKTENSASTKLGVSTTQTVNYGVYQGTASASLGVESTRKEARETTHKQNRDQTEKLSTEIKRSFKSVFRTVTEHTDTRSRRYILQNTSKDLINYELRRKMRRVGVQMQGLGERLCWQVFIDDPGAALGLAELVHFADSPDLTSLKPQEIPPPITIVKRVSAPVPFQGMRTNDDNGPGADYGDVGGPDDEGKFHGHRTNTNDENAADFEVVMGPFFYKFDPPQPDYYLTDVRIIGPQSGKRAATRLHKKGIDGSFELVMESINFAGSNEVLVDVDLVFVPDKPVWGAYEKAKLDAKATYDAEKQRLLEKAFIESVRQRIKDASNVTSRPSWDLREEERIIVYRALIEKLMLDSWQIAKKDPKDGNNSRLSHVRAEVIRAIFDVDAMLYFVAPEWWMPRRHKSQYDGSAAFNLTDKDLVKWDDIEKREDNYKITEDSTTAKLGSSLGWLLQLDGDNLRNAFLNAPWVKAVIPIRPGREKAALNWLRKIEGHESDGWDTSYPASNAEDTKLVAQVVADGKAPTIGNVLDKIAEQLQAANGDITNALEADEVFEHGFDHLGKAFDASVDPNKPFSQWISILPTDQLVAVEYVANTLFKP